MRSRTVLGERTQTLFAPEIGYVVLDVRSEYEVNSGKVPGATNIPLINVKTQWSSETNARSFDQTPNSAFMTQVAKKFPNKETKILIMCSDGMDRAIQVGFRRPTRSRTSHHQSAVSFAQAP